MDAEIDRETWRRYYFDVEYHFQVEFVGAICAWIGRWIELGDE